MANTTLPDIIHTPLDELLNEANRVRSETFKNEVDLCAIVNIKNGRCAMDCRFCAQSQHHNTTIETHPLIQIDELSSATCKFWEQNIPRVGWVASGRSLKTDELDTVLDGVKSILSGERAKQVCASLGQLDSSELSALKDVGVCRYHHNLETSERFYPSICTTQRWKDRRATVERVKELGWKICSGGLFGLGETWEDRLQLALTLKTLEVDSVPINFFSPISGAPLADRQPLSSEEALRIVALFRLTLPKATIRICGGRPMVFTAREQDELLFRAGANAFMTGNYLTTSGISPEKDREMFQHLTASKGHSIPRQGYSS